MRRQVYERGRSCRVTWDSGQSKIYSLGDAGVYPLCIAAARTTDPTAVAASDRSPTSIARSKGLANRSDSDVLSVQSSVAARAERAPILGQDAGGLRLSRGPLVAPPRVGDLVGVDRPGGPADGVIVGRVLGEEPAAFALAAGGGDSGPGVDWARRMLRVQVAATAASAAIATAGTADASLPTASVGTEGVNAVRCVTCAY